MNRRRLFEPGRLLITRLLVDVLTTGDAMDLVQRHIHGDWGDLDDEDAAANRYAVQHGLRILSSYTVRGIRVWVITEADRNSTTVLEPSDY